MANGFREHDFLRWLRGRAPDARLTVPIGDDAAVFRSADGARLVLACDAVVEGRHAETGDLEGLARKVVRCNVSDMAAMGAVGEAFLLALKLPPGADAGTARAIATRVAEECDRYGLAFAGGDTVTGEGGVLLAGTIVGRSIAAPVLRSGARPGDAIVVTGALGGSLLGRHRDFEPRTHQARLLVEHGPPSAMTDVSDGLSRDLANILEASGVGAVLDVGNLPVSAAAVTAAARDGRSPLDHALDDGEDFELVATLSPAALATVRANWSGDAALTVIGRIQKESGMFLIDRDGTRVARAPGGFDHGA